jgi:hypothetical protein
MKLALKAEMAVMSRRNTIFRKVAGEPNRSYVEITILYILKTSISHSTFTQISRHWKLCLKERLNNLDWEGRKKGRKRKMEDMVKCNSLLYTERLYPRISEKKNVKTNFSKSMTCKSRLSNPEIRVLI